MYQDGRAISYKYTARLDVDFDSDKPLDGFDVNQDLVSLFDKIFTQALAQSIDELKLVVDNEEELANVDIKVNIWDSNTTELDY
jgi:hypothetical protein